MQKTFLSSPAWIEFQKSLGHQVEEIDNSDFELVAVISQKLNFKQIYCPYMPIIKSKQGWQKADQFLTKLAKKHQVISVEIEPLGKITDQQLKDDNWQKVKSIQPDLTLTLDLNQSNDQIMSQLKSRNRNYYRSSVKRGLSFEQSDKKADLEIFFQLLNEIAKHNKVNLASTSYLRSQTKILMPAGLMKYFVVKFEDKIIGGCLVYDYNGIRYYGHVATDYEHRKLNAGAYLMVELILNAKKQGLTTFDFVGITDSDDPKHPWYGFSQFKKSFGGQELRRLGTWRKIYRPIPFFVLKKARQIKKRISLLTK